MPRARAGRAARRALRTRWPRRATRTSLWRDWCVPFADAPGAPELTRTRRARASSATARAAPPPCASAMAAAMVARPRAALLVAVAAALVMACTAPAPALAARALMMEDGDSNGSCARLNETCTTTADCCMLKDCVMNLDPNATDNAFCGDAECVDGVCGMVHRSVVASDSCLWPGTICIGAGPKPCCGGTCACQTLSAGWNGLCRRRSAACCNLNTEH